MGSGWCEKDLFEDLGFELADTAYFREGAGRQGSSR